MTARHACQAARCMAGPNVSVRAVQFRWLSAGVGVGVVTSRPRPAVSPSSSSSSPARQTLPPHLASASISACPIHSSTRASSSTATPRRRRRLPPPLAEVASIIAALSPSTPPLRYEEIFPLLHHPLDSASVICLLPSVLDAMGSRSLSHARKVVKAFLPHIGRKRMIALVPILSVRVMELAELAVSSNGAAVGHEGAGKGMEMGGELHTALMKLYDTFLQRLRYFLEQPARGTNKAYLEENALPLPVRMEVLKLVQHLITLLQRLPSSSNVEHQPHLSTAILTRLFSRRYLTPELRRVLVHHCEEYEIEMRVEWLRQCGLSAIGEGDEEAAEQYRAWMAEARQKIAERKSSLNLGTADQANDRLKQEHSGRRQALRVVGEILLARGGRSWADTLGAIEQYLHPAETDVEDRTGSFTENEHSYGHGYATAKAEAKASQYAWSVLLSRLSSDRSIDIDALKEMASAMPTSAVVGHTITPVMHGLLRRGEALQAWEIWRDLVEREREWTALSQMENEGDGQRQDEQRGRKDEARLIDRVALAVATETCWEASNLDAAVTLVDTWAIRPWMARSNTAKPAVNNNERDGNNADSDSTQRSLPNPPSSANANPDLTHSLILDAQNINVLLHMCKKDNRPSIAFRLWTAALPRYGVYLDDISLNLLLDTARFADLNHESKSDEDMFRTRLREMVEGFGLRRVKTRARASMATTTAMARGPDGSGEGEIYDAYDAAGFAKGSPAVLLDPPHYRWKDDHGDVKPWQLARETFRKVVLGNWPRLAEIKSPLEHQAFFDTLFGVSSDDPSDLSTSGSGGSGSRKQYVPLPLPLPSPNARYTHIIPTSLTFQSYIALLGYHNLPAEIPLALAWMKDLDLVPRWETMVLSLLHICESEGPRRWVRAWTEGGDGALVRDEEILRRWLEDWLVGRGVRVPSEQEVAARRRWLAERKMRISA